MCVLCVRCVRMGGCVYVPCVCVCCVYVACVCACQLLLRELCATPAVAVEDCYEHFKEYLLRHARLAAADVSDGGADVSGVADAGSEVVDDPDAEYARQRAGGSLCRARMDAQTRSID